MFDTFKKAVLGKYRCGFSPNLLFVGRNLLAVLVQLSVQLLFFAFGQMAAIGFDLGTLLGFDSGLFAAQLFCLPLAQPSVLNSIRDPLVLILDPRVHFFNPWMILLFIAIDLAAVLIEFLVELLLLIFRQISAVRFHFRFFLSLDAGEFT